MNLKNLIGFKERNFGFYVTLAFGVLLLVTGIIYVANYQDDFVILHAQIPYNVAIAALLFISGILVLGLSAFKVTCKFAPYVGGVGILTSFCLIILDTYMFIANCLIDIDFHPEELSTPAFLIPLIFVVITFVVGLVNCFLPQVKKCKCEEQCTCKECKCEENKEETVDEK